MNQTTAPSSNAHFQGWVQSPNGRGTLDILWSCASTLFLSVWVMLHLNIPAASDSQVQIFFRRAKWFLWGLLSPELLMLFAGGQWASANRSVADMADLHLENWSIVHAFYADSGGFMLQAQDFSKFPVTAKQMHYLISYGYITPPAITRKEIWDKSKADILAKTIAALQIFWFVAQIIARAIQHLPITLLELATATIITCTLATFFFWFHKPLNVETPTIITLETPVATIIEKSQHTLAENFRDTPLDFIEPLTYTSSQMPFNRLWGVQQRPLPRIPNDRDTQIHNLATLMITAVPTAAFGTLHLVAWNFDFPTRIEQMLWRYTTLGMTIILAIGCVVEAAAIVSSDYTTTSLTNLNGYKLRWPTNILFFAPGILYFLARMIVVVEVLISLRSLPAGCFDTINWTNLFPHI